MSVNGHKETMVFKIFGKMVFLAKGEDSFNEVSFPK